MHDTKAFRIYHRPAFIYERYDCLTVTIRVMITHLRSEARGMEREIQIGIE